MDTVELSGARVVIRDLMLEDEDAAEGLNSSRLRARGRTDERR